MFDRAIINPEDDIELSRLLTDILSLYREKHHVSEKRDRCFDESNTFQYYLEKEYPEIKAELIESRFRIDDPIRLPLDMNDLKSSEDRAFRKIYSSKDIKAMKKLELSKLIYDFIVEYHHGKVPADLLSFYHVYLLIEDRIIVDLTCKQFKNAVNGPITKDRYNI